MRSTNSFRETAITDFADLNLDAAKARIAVDELGVTTSKLKSAMNYNPKYLCKQGQYGESYICLFNCFSIPFCCHSFG
jgi:hypothetical protein